MTGRAGRALAAVVAASTLSGCAARLPDVAPIASMDAVKDQMLDRLYKDNDHQPVEHKPLRSATLSVVRAYKPVSSEMRARPANYSFNSDKPTLGDLVETLGIDGVQVSVPAMPDASAGGGFTPPQSASAPESPSHSGTTLQGILAGTGKRSEALSSAPAPSARSSDRGDGKSSDIYARRLPFARHNGNLGNLLDSLKTSAGLVSWQEGDTIYLSDRDRFAVTVPQDAEIVGQVGQTIHDLGGSDIVASVQGGKIFYSAPAGLQKDTIGPYLLKSMRNVATVNLQVAIVSLAVNDKSGKGFDWSQFGTSLGNAGLLAGSNGGVGTTAGSTLANGYGNAYGSGVGNTAIGNGYGTNGLGTNGVGTGGIGTGTGLGTNASGLAGTVSSASDAVNLSLAGSGRIMGIRTIGSISTAVNYLSNFGSANVKQNLDLRTLAGKIVKFAAQDEIPYVKSVGIGGIGSSGIGSSGYGGNSTLGTAQTDVVKTGLEVSMLPQFDSDNDLVEIDMKMTLASLIEMLQLNAGAQLGTLTQPHTQKQELTDILRIKAGQTAVIGGLQVDSDQRNGNEPTALRELGNTDTSYGSRTQDVQRTALFIIIRPTVVVYDTEGRRR